MFQEPKIQQSLMDVVWSRICVVYVF